MGIFIILGVLLLVEAAKYNEKIENNLKTSNKQYSKKSNHGKYENKNQEFNGKEQFKHGTIKNKENVREKQSQYNKVTEIKEQVKEKVSSDSAYNSENNKTPSAGKNFKNNKKPRNQNNKYKSDKYTKNLEPEISGSVAKEESSDSKESLKTNDNNSQKKEKIRQKRETPKTKTPDKTPKSEEDGTIPAVPVNAEIEESSRNTADLSSAEVNQTAKECTCHTKTVEPVDICSKPIDIASSNLTPDQCVSEAGALV